MYTLLPYRILYMYTLLPWLWHLLGAERAGRKSGIVWSRSVFSRRFRGSRRNPDEVHGTLTARRQFPIHFSVGTDPDKKGPTLPRDRPTGKDKGLRRLYTLRLAAAVRYSCKQAVRLYSYCISYDPCMVQP
jgi:hypothetical protein